MTRCHDPFLDALEPVLARYRDARARRESLALLKAVRLAPALEVCEALLRDERVPRSRLDALWVKAYGL